MTARAIQYRRGTTTEHSSFTGLNGEITVDTDKKVVIVHDEQTAGGFEMARADMNNVSQASLLAKIGNINLDTSNLADIDLSNLSATGQAIIDGKADTDATNFTTTGKETIVGWGMPDTSSPTSLSNNTVYQTTTDGFIYIVCVGGSANEFILVSKTDNTLSTYDYSIGLYSSTSFGNHSGRYFLPIPKGYYYKITVYSTLQVSKFIPCKGEI